MSVVPPGAGPGERVVLFDGVCRLCSAWAGFVIRWDKRARLKLASLQSDAGQALLGHFSLPKADLDTMVFIEDGRAYTLSTAALRVARHLPWPWRALGWARVVPARARDWLYRRLARSRYHLFGRRTECLVPTPETRGRFL